jgi:hypothetical protein
MNDFKLIQERQKAKLLFREYEAILVLINQMTTVRRLEYVKKIEMIEYLEKKELREFSKNVNSEILYLRNYYGAKVPNSVMVGVLEKIESGIENRIWYISKFKLKEIFKNYHKIMLDFDKLPEHSKIAVDIGIFEGKKKVEYFILEAAIFEDMCSIFNLLKERLIKNNKIEIISDKKKNIALMRTVVLTAFNFVEAFLNGIASDYFFSNFHNLDDKTRIILTEWDHIQGKPRYLSLRDKVLKYLRIVCKSSFPPLQESNCDELAFIIEKAKAIRDSIVHPSSIHGLGFKEEEIFKLEIGEVEKIIDTSIKLVNRIEVLIYGNNNDRIRWIYERDKNGFFPEEVFF